MMSMNGKQFTISAILLGILTLFAIYIWPTRYMFTYMKNGSVEVVIRIDRFTGEAEWLLPTVGWQEMKLTPTPTPLSYIDPFEEKRKRLEREKALGIVDRFASPTPKPSSGN